MKIIILHIISLGLTRFFQWLVNGGMLCILTG